MRLITLAYDVAVHKIGPAPGTDGNEGLIAATATTPRVSAIEHRPEQIGAGPLLAQSGHCYSGSGRHVHDSRGNAVSQALALEQDYPIGLKKPRVPVPREFVGKARLLTNRIGKLNNQVLDASREAFAPLRDRAERNPVPRRETMIEAIGLWEERMPQDGRLSINVDLQKKSLHIHELRASGAEYSKDPWHGDHVPAILLLAFHMQATREMTKLHTETRVMLSFHCLGRWYQRSADTSEPVLLCDMLKLVQSYDQIREQCRKNAGKWELAAPSGGKFHGTWCYRIRDGKRHYFATAETYIPEAVIRWAN